MRQYKTLNRELEKFAKLVIEAAQRNIGTTRKVNGKSRRIDATGNLRNSLKYTLKNKRLTFTSTAEYGYIVEYGRRKGARMPPIEPILRWMKVKKIRLRNKKGFVKETPERRRALAFVIARKIGREGTKPTMFYNDALNSTLKKHGKMIERAILKDFDLFLNLDR